ncbi:hypothetical protein ACI50E_17970 [Brucella sp. ZJ1_1]|nr:hypothetical protein [Brucella intermedia]
MADYDFVSWRLEIEPAAPSFRRSRTVHWSRSIVESVTSVEV